MAYSHESKQPYAQHEVWHDEARALWFAIDTPSLAISFWVAGTVAGASSRTRYIRRCRD